VQPNHELAGIAREAVRMRIGFLINPIAGMGGRVGLKGTDDKVGEARRLGARPVAPVRAAAAMNRLRVLIAERHDKTELKWLTCAGSMGEDVLRQSGIEDYSVIYSPKDETTAADTRAAVEAFVRAGIDLILFCGGDGTARDVSDIAGERTPILGIPSGVKMYSGVFATTPERTAEIVLGYAAGHLEAAETDVLDLDEEQYRRGIWSIRLTGSARTPQEPTFTQAAKAVISEQGDDNVKADIADELVAEITSHPDTLYLLGPGSTVKSIADSLDLDKSLLGIDAVIGGRIVGRDLNEAAIIDLLDRHPDARLVLSPIGAQGFVLGRGNLQVSPSVVRRIGTQNLIVIATPAKLRRTPLLRFDTGESDLDADIASTGFLPVVVGYHRRRLVALSV
jgi:predicted polyphosphate/ATP-dependent NAD kinase